MNRIYRLRSGDVTELVFLSLPPLILGSLYFIAPISLQEQLALNHTNPRWYTFWTNALVHEHQPDDRHLWMNVLGYLLLTIPTLALYKIRADSRRFWGAFFVILIVGPVISSVSSYIVFHELLELQILYDRGFSGVVGAFDGFLIVTILYVLGEEQPEPVAVLSMWIYFSYLIMGLGASTGRIYFLIIGAIAMVGSMFAGGTKYVASWTELSDWGVDNRKLGLVLIAAVLVSALAFAAALPSDIAAGGSLKNIVAHGVGIVFGMFLRVLSQSIVSSEVVSEPI